jgi:hypothetical protein
MIQGRGQLMLSPLFLWLCLSYLPLKKVRFQYTTELILVSSYIKYTIRRH